MSNTQEPSTKTTAEKPAQWPNSVRPSLMFLPPKIKGARARQKAVRQTLVGAAALLLVTAGAYAVVAVGTAIDSDNLAKEKSAGEQFTQVLAENAPFTNYYKGFEDRKAAVAKALDQDTSHSKIIKAINDSNNVNATFTSMSKVDSKGACLRSDLFVPSAAIDCYALTGYTAHIDDVGKLVESISSSKSLLTSPYVTESSSGDGRTSFKLTVGYTSDAFSLKGSKFLPPDEASTSVPAAPSEKVAP